MNQIREKVSNSYFEALYAIIGDAEAAHAVMGQFVNVNALSKASEQELTMVEGLGPARAKRLIGAVALSKHAIVGDAKPVIHSPEDAADLVQYEMSMLEQEELRVVNLNTRNHVLSIKTIYRGSLNSSAIRVGELFRCAIRENAAAIIVIHNHPSGDPSPSPDDVAITKAIIEAGKMLDIQVLDHLIIGEGRFISLNRRGLGFSE